MDDLSVPSDGDVVKPSISWKVLPRLIGQRLRPGGFAVFNLLPRSKGKWDPDLEKIVGLFNPTFDTHGLFSWRPADFLGFSRAGGQRSSLQFTLGSRRQLALCAQARWRLFGQL